VLHLKEQITPQDSVYVRLHYYRSESGDVNHYYDPRDANPGFRARERYNPSGLVGYHREWRPGSHTLVLAGRLENVYRFSNPAHGTLFFNRGFVGNPVEDVVPLFYEQDYRSGFRRRQHLEATLHQARLFALWNHPTGFFARAGAIWTAQSNHGYTPARPGDDFWQFNLEAGYRFARRHAELRVGLLNLTDQDYRLNPLNLTSDLPRDRTLAVSFLFNF
jgi:hypothetical protein